MKEQYINFDEYIRQGEPGQREAAYAWSTAIGLQAVDGLRTSDYLNDLARRNIEGEITIDEVDSLLDSYYKSKTTREADDDNKEEADRASKNIKRILSTVTLDFTTNGLISIHRRIFEGVLKHAGELRKYDITKKEWILEGDTVRYLNWEDLRRALDYDIQQERAFIYKGKSPTKDWSEQPNLTTRTSTHTSTRTSTRQVPEQVQDLLHTSNPLIIKLIMVIGNEELSVSQLMERTGLKHRPNFIEYHLNPAIAEGYVRLLYPLSPRHPRQEYHLSEWRRHSILRIRFRWPYLVHEEETYQGR